MHMRKRIYATGEEMDKAAARKILAFYRRKNLQRSARMIAIQVGARNARRRANRAERLRASVVVL
jgi:hypothetical protein